MCVSQTRIFITRDQRSDYETEYLFHSTYLPQINSYVRPGQETAQAAAVPVDVPLDVAVDLPEVEALRPDARVDLEGHRDGEDEAHHVHPDRRRLLIHFVVHFQAFVERRC